jgi:hypothetical protein
LILVQVLYRLIPVIRLGIEQRLITFEDRRIDGIHRQKKATPKAATPQFLLLANVVREAAKCGNKKKSPGKSLNFT